MKKILFNDRYGLTEAVLEGRKTMTRRIIRNVIVTQELNEIDEDGDMGGADTRIIIDRFSSYKVGEVVAVAQSYSDIGLQFTPHLDPSLKTRRTRYPQWGNATKMRAWNNKMFVRADLMPHQIRITNVRVERMQDISDEDCFREGIYKKTLCPPGDIDYFYHSEPRSKWDVYPSAREAFAALIDKISGKGTWESNPWMFVYEFGLVK